MSQPAIGNTVKVALGQERPGEHGVPAPDPGLVTYDAILPADLMVVGEENESTQVNPLGLKKKGIPGPKRGEATMSIALTARHILEFLYAIFGAVTKANPTGSVYTYTFAPNFASHTAASFWGHFSKPPVERGLFYGFALEGLSMEIGDNELIPCELTGRITHGTWCGPAVVDGSNTGTYDLGPWLRGTLADEAAGTIWVLVTDDDPLTYKVLQATSEPDGAAWSAASTTFTQTYDADGNAVWNNVRSSSTGLDLGIWNENKDPLEIIFPGTATDHQDMAAADAWSFLAPGAWSDPSSTAITGADRYTSAHWKTEFRALGAGTWVEKVVRGGTVGFMWALGEHRGNLSRYTRDVFRTGNFTATAEIERDFVETFFARAHDRHERIEMRMSFEGRQLTSAYREGIVATYGDVAIVGAGRPAEDGDQVIETLELTAETDDSSNAPVSVVVTTSRNWTPETV